MVLTNYQAMIDAIRARGMEPIVVLSHLSLPAWVLTLPQSKGDTVAHEAGADASDPDFKNSLRGWEASETIDAFVDYVEHVVSGLNNVRYWITFNEPLATTILTGYIASVFPPGFLGAGLRAVSAGLNIIDAHAKADESIKVIDATAQVGITDQWMYCKPTPDTGATDQFVDHHQDFLINALIYGVKDRAISVDNPDKERVLGISEADWTPHLDFFGLQDQQIRLCRKPASLVANRRGFCWWSGWSRRSKPRRAWSRQRHGLGRWYPVWPVQLLKRSYNGFQCSMAVPCQS